MEMISSGPYSSRQFICSMKHLTRLLSNKNAISTSLFKYLAISHNQKYVYFYSPCNPILLVVTTNLCHPLPHHTHVKVDGRTFLCLQI